MDKLTKKKIEAACEFIKKGGCCNRHVIRMARDFLKSILKNETN